MGNIKKEECRHRNGKRTVHHSRRFDAWQSLRRSSPCNVQGEDDSVTRHLDARPICYIYVGYIYLTILYNRSPAARHI